MKKEALFIIAFLLATTAYADCDITDTINEGLHITPSIEGKDYNISFTSYINGSAKFKVNGVSTSNLGPGTKHSFDDLSDLTPMSITGSSGSSIAEICFNAGLSGKTGTCSSSKECDDSNPCTIDECDGDPLRCHHKLILWCRDNDGCCPESRCTYEQDNDCQASDECTTDSDCNDNNSLTKDICQGTPKKCDNTIITECISGDDYCPDDCAFTLDMDCDECSTDNDCNDNNACTSDTCAGTPKKCSNTITSGCNSSGECIQTGTRTEDKFCHTDNTMQRLRTKKEYCDNNYECLNNQCIENKCKSPFFIKSIINWFKGLFGK